MYFTANHIYIDYLLQKFKSNVSASWLVRELVCRRVVLLPNTLSQNVTSASSMSVYMKRLKTHLFSQSFPLKSPAVHINDRSFHLLYLYKSPRCREVTIKGCQTTFKHASAVVSCQNRYGQNGDKPKRLQVQSKRVNLLSSTMDLFSVAYF